MLHTSFIHNTHAPHLLKVTGVKSIAQLKTCKAEMEERFDIKIIKYKIDHLFFSKKKDHRNIDLDKLYQYLHGHEKYYASYCHELFMGMHRLPKD